MSENRTGGSPFFLMILLSLMIHLGAWKLAELVPESKPQEPSGEWINVSFRESPKTIILPDQMQNKKDDGKSVPLTSKNRNRVHQQSIAPMFGDTANRGGVKKQNKIDVKPRPIRMADESDVTVPKTLSLDPGPSTVTTTIDGVNVGAITALDTDAADIRYYTFFSRIIPQLRPRWERALLFAARNQLMLTSSSQVTKDWATVVDFYLDKEGKLVHSTIRRKSGLPSLDEAAVSAFEDAAPFLNPPQEMVDENGLIRMRFGFIYHAPKALAERR